MTDSKNQRAQNICGLRDTNGMTMDMPTELGYQCPVCKLQNDELLDWSEYETFLWCQRCNKDYPSCFCLIDMDRSINTYLDCVAYLKKSQV